MCICVDVFFCVKFFLGVTACTCICFGVFSGTYSGWWFGTWMDYFLIGKPSINGPYIYTVIIYIYIYIYIYIFHHGTYYKVYLCVVLDLGMSPSAGPFPRPFRTAGLPLAAALRGEVGDGRWWQWDLLEECPRFYWDPMDYPWLVGGLKTIGKP